MNNYEIDNNKLDEIYDGNFENFSRGYLDYVKTLIDSVEISKLNSFYEMIIEARLNNNKIFFIGNGGSASTASHFANDIAVGSKSIQKPIKAISLTDNQAILTAIANDYGYEYIFTKQLEILASPSDILVAITASGNSENIVHALKYANNISMKTLSITGFDGGIAKKISNKNIPIKTKKGEYGPVEDLHMIIAGLMGSYLIRFIRDL